MLEAVRVVGVVVRGGRVVGVVKVVKARWRQAKNYPRVVGVVKVVKARWRQTKTTQETENLSGYHWRRPKGSADNIQYQLACVYKLGLGAASD